MNIGCQFGGCDCAAGKTVCDCVNQQIVQEVHAEFDTLAVREDWDERYALTELGHRVAEWFCAIGIVLVVGLIVFGVL